MTIANVPAFGSLLLKVMAFTAFFANTTWAQLPNAPQGGSPILLRAGQPIGAGFKSLIAVKDLVYEGKVIRGVAYAEIGGEIGVVRQSDGDWQYKIRGADGKPLRLKQAGDIGPFDDLWIEQPYEVLDRQNRLVFRSTGTPPTVPGGRFPPQLIGSDVPESQLRATVVYASGATAEVEQVFIKYEFGEENTPPPSFTLYTPVRHQSNVLHLAIKSGNSVSTQSIPLKDIKRLRCQFITDDDSTLGVVRKITVELVSGQSLTNVSVNFMALAKKRHVFATLAEIVGHSTQWGPFKLSLNGFFVEDDFSIMADVRRNDEPDESYHRRIRIDKERQLREKGNQLISEIRFANTK
nr:hypothetical protein [uncultured bacterium]